MFLVNNCFYEKSTYGPLNTFYFKTLLGLPPGSFLMGFFSVKTVGTNAVFRADSESDIYFGLRLSY